MAPTRTHELGASQKTSLTPAQVMGEMVKRKTYCAWLEEKGRRETWDETVGRAVRYLRNQYDLRKDSSNAKIQMDDSMWAEIHQEIFDCEVFPSMRLLQFAGKPADRSHACIYNCAFVELTCIEDFKDSMYVLLGGSGLGFSVRAETVNKLPDVLEDKHLPVKSHQVADSSEGWCDAFWYGLSAWFNGYDVTFDYSLVRPMGARLKTKGGRASGPAPLRRLLNFSRKIIRNAAGRKLSSIEVQDIMCMVGTIVVAGGVRRSAMISLSDLEDQDLANAKASSDWYKNHPQRASANNSAVYDEKPTIEELTKEMTTMYHSGSGERGILSAHMARGGRSARRRRFICENGILYLGCNPCGEIFLRSYQFCNLTENVCRMRDTKERLLRKCFLATVIGTIQASMTDMGDYLSPKWKEVTESEALLGVSLTGIQECPALQDDELLRQLRACAVETNKLMAETLGINPATAVTCVKPSGTASIVAGTSSGIHNPYAAYYIRRVRMPSTESLTQFMKAKGVPCEDAIVYKGIQEEEEEEEESDFSIVNTQTTEILSFPIKASAAAKTFAVTETAMTQLNNWLRFSTNYTEHNVSCTVTMDEDEIIPVVEWLHEHWDEVGGLAFIKRTDHTYAQAPYEAITEEEYNELYEAFPKNFTFDDFPKFETEDTTQRSGQLACSGGSCELYV